MNNILCRLGSVSATSGIYRNFSVSATNYASYSCKLLVVGGGSAGCTMAAKFARKLKKDSVVVLEPSSDHYYQPLWTLVGAGVTPVSATRRDARGVLPSSAKWLQDSAESIDPKNNVVKTTSGDVINYEYLIVAVGLVNDYGKVPGLKEALKDKSSGVSTIYSHEYCEKTWSDIKNFKGGDAVFTYPDTPIKCPGAPQKIAYMADSYFTKSNVRSKSNITYNTCLPVIFGVKKYADALMKVIARKNIHVNYKTVLKEIKFDKKEAVFFNTEDKTKLTTLPYDLLHVTPPMKTPDFLQNSKDMTDECGFLTVDKYTLQHTKYSNIYGLGDCTNTPNSKTAAAIAKQSYVVEQNLLQTMKASPPARRYDGYGACPLVTSYGTCVLAEFIYDGVPRETLPFDQAQESTLAYYMKRDLFPFLYWNFMLKGYYNGPEFMGITGNYLKLFKSNVRELCSRKASCKNEFRCKLLVVGGGTGGCSVAWRFSRKLNDKDIIVLEPNTEHYYQPLFSLVAAGIKQFPQSHKPIKSVLPRNVLWLKDQVDDFDPCNNVVHTGCGFKVRYEYIVVAVGLKNDYEQILGLKEALNDPISRVSTIYSPEYCQKCWCCIQNFKGGHAIFTFPKQAGKCSGAAQKIMYLAHDYWRQKNVITSTNITYNTAGDAIFGVPKYAAALTKIAFNKNIVVNFTQELIEVTKRSAIFLDSKGQTIALPYNFLHITPPMSPPVCLMRCEELTNEAGYLDVDRHTLQHRRYNNVYGIGDCISSPNSKTAAAVANQSRIVELNLWNTMYGKEPTAKYYGYAACPMLTSFKTGILAEFLYDKKICETFPFDQSKERRLIYLINKDILPYIYWNKLIKGRWNGPSVIRKIINPLGR
ncbi:unnamed protein product, partial [Brenthis ino]